MNKRLYLLPNVYMEPPDVRMPGWYPKYSNLKKLEWTVLSWEWGEGTDPGWCLMILNAEDADHTWLAGQSDVTQFPADIDQYLTEAHVTQYENKFEAANLPAEWVNTSRTHRETLAYFEGFIHFLARYQVVNAGHVMKLFSGSVDLETQYVDLPDNAKTGLLSTAASMSLDTSGVTGTSTLREIIKEIGTQTVAAGTWTPFLDIY